jgi:hypothetical protein
VELALVPLDAPGWMLLWVSRRELAAASAGKVRMTQTASAIRIMRCLMTRGKKGGKEDDQGTFNRTRGRAARIAFAAPAAPPLSAT